MKHTLFYAASAAAITVVANTQSFAQTTPHPTPDLDDNIIVTGKKLEERMLKSLHSPSFGVGISEEQIAAVNVFNVEDSFKYAPNLNVRKRYSGDSNSTLSFRGSHSFQTPRALVSIDGFTISNFLGASYNTSPKWGVLAPHDIDRVEIIYGPSSARYSGHSLGGTLLLSTRQIKENQARFSVQAFRSNYDYYATDVTLDGYSFDAGLDYVISDRATFGVSYRFFKNEGQPQSWRRIVGRTDRANLINDGVVSADYFDQAIRDDELGFLRIASQDSIVDVEQHQFRLRGNYELNHAWDARVILALQLNDTDKSNPRSFLKDKNGKPSFIGISGVKQSVTEKSELLVGIGLEGQIGNWGVDFALSRFDVLSSESRSSNNFNTRTGAAPDTGRITNGDDVYWNSFEVVAENGYGDHEIAIGLSYAGYNFDTPRYYTDDWLTGEAGTLSDSSGGKTELFGAFVEDKWTLSPKWVATLGLRAETWRANDGFLAKGNTHVHYAKRKKSALSPKAALSFTPNDDWEAKSSFALATRFPTVQELYQASLISFGPNVGELDFGAFNPNLVPEQGLDMQFTVSRFFKNATLRASVFRQDVDDTLFQQTVPELSKSVITNIATVRTDGVDFVLATEDLFISGLAIDANASLLNAEITRNEIDPTLVGNSFPRVPNVRANASVRYSPNKNWVVAAGWRYQDTPDRNIANSSTSKCQTYFCVSKFSIVDVKATRHFGNIDVSIGIDNITDERAFVYHPYPGRTALVEINWRGGF